MPRLRCSDLVPQRSSSTTGTFPAILFDDFVVLNGGLPDLAWSFIANLPAGALQAVVQCLSLLFS
jgi:hypothetical protein